MTLTHEDSHRLRVLLEALTHAFVSAPPDSEIGLVIEKRHDGRVGRMSRVVPSVYPLTNLPDRVDTKT